MFISYDSTISSVLLTLINLMALHFITLILSWINVYIDMIFSLHDKVQWIAIKKPCTTAFKHLQLLNMFESEKTNRFN